MKRDEIIQRARKELGVKWQHQAALSGVACDCVGLIGLTGGEFGLTIDKDDLRYSRQPHHKDEILYEKMQKYLTEIPLAEAKPGDILLFGFNGLPAYHIAILSYDNFLIHTWLDVGKVVESRFDPYWQSCLRYAFRFPGVED